MYRVAVITSSDKGAAGQREDKSGGIICDMVKQKGFEVVSTMILPDEKELLKQQMKLICDQNQADLILTTGGTGFSPRDVMPEATAEIAQKLVPGISEAMRYGAMQITKRAMLSRGISVIRETTLIINLPGSPKAVRENLEFILDELDHGLAILTGKATECAREDKING